LNSWDKGNPDRQKLKLMEKSLMWDACGFNLAVALVPSQGKKPAALTQAGKGQQHC